MLISGVPLHLGFLFILTRDDYTNILDFGGGHHDLVDALFDDFGGGHHDLVDSCLSYV